MTAFPATNLSQSRKAAMVVQILLRDGGDLPLAQLPEDAQARLTKELGALNLIDRATLHSVAEEFARELSDVGLTPPGSIEAALKSLDGRISPATAARLRDEAAGRSGSDPWAMVLNLDVEDMVPITQAESPEVSAILLSKLPTAKAAFSNTAESRIGAILNSTAAAKREEILEGLLADDKVFGEGVRKSIFTFEDIPDRVAEMDVPKIMRDIDPSELVRALASATAAGGALDAAASHLLENRSKRMAENLREEMAEAGTIKQAEAESVQNAVVTAIRDAADAGTITLLDPESDD